MAGFRTIVINKRCKLELRLGYLVIRTVDETKIFISEIENLIIESTSVVITVSLMVKLMEEGVNVVICDEYHLPTCSLQSLHGNYNTSKNIKIQIGWLAERKALCWKFIIKEKIKQQAQVLHRINKIDDEKQLISYMNVVSDGDPDNQEAKAAKCYFLSLFGYDFSRDNYNFKENSALNYGYSLLLSCFAREISACGYFSEIGIWHKSMTNHLNLACDLMEPFRPLVDRLVYDMPVTCEDDFKHYMISIFDKKVIIDGEKQTLVFGIRQYVRRIIRFMNKETEQLYELSFEVNE